ncbi:exodeoxyribonuclease V subunit gamma [uncultured Friedmanniella sp.]|uniref:exodeoxyribonuclease V subunit gamma n=1 Tax=uncultured Friedmanniella sp. TaxID=335381 RepID=UPI0035CB219A
MSLHLHRAERADRLVAALGEVLAAPLPDPFRTEVVSVPTPGVERWLTQRLATQLGTGPGGGDGVCAGISFPSPRLLVARALGEREGSTVPDPWRPEHAVWPLLRVLDAGRGEAWSQILWRYLGDRPSITAGPVNPGSGIAEPDTVGPAEAARSGRRWSTARHLAGLFARYAAARPAMLLGWAAGRDSDGEGRPLGPDRAWQAELWRRLRAEIAQPGPAERIDVGVGLLRADPATSDLPERVSVFGPTRMEPQHVRVLDALAVGREVHLWLPHPSPALWDRLARSGRPGAGAGPVGTLPPRRSEPEDAAAHRLLGCLGRDVRELQLVLTAAGAAGQDEHLSPWTGSRPGAAPSTLLQQLQADIVADRPLAEVGRPTLAPGDRSIALHASHGPDRQVEVLREVLVGLLEDDPTLEPRDIVVMCPDIETYAPLVAATFGLDSDDTTAEHPGHRLRVRLADRSLRQVNPLLSVLSRLVGLAAARMESTALLDFCAAPPVARRFGFGAEELERLHDLVTSSGVRWGLDSAHRAAFGMAGFGQNTWSAGLDRLLLGVTMDETGQHFLGTALPLDDVDSADVDLVGRLAEFVSRLASVTDRCRTPQPLPAWVALFREALELLTHVPAGESWQVGHANAELLRLSETAADGPRTDGPRTDGSDALLSLPEVTALLAEAFRGRPGRSNFRTGTLTMCTMHPMRSIPHRVVCLLGLDDGVFPRRRRVDGDDVTAVVEHLGDADPRSEDRQLLLDAVLAAEEHLVVVYAGMDARTGSDVPPAVPVKELMDTLDLTARSGEGRPVSSVVTVRHRLQPYDPANFTGFSFDRAALRGARAAVAARTAPVAVFGRTALAPLPGDGPVELAELIRFFRHPVRALLRSRAGVSFYADEDVAEPQIPVDLDGLGRWEIGERLLQLHLQGAELDVLQAAEWRRGLLPPRAFGSRVMEAVSQQVVEVRTAAAPFREQPAAKVEIAGRLSGRPLVGTVTGIHGDDVVAVSFSRLSARHRLVAWLELLALTVAHPGRPWRAVCVGRRGTAVLGPVEPAWAERALADLVALQQLGLREPLPFAPKTSARYSQVRRIGQELTKQHWSDLHKEWDQETDESYGRFFGTDPDGGGRSGLDLLLAEPSRPGEELGALVEPTRFGTLARRVFDPLLYIEAQS